MPGRRFWILAASLALTLATSAAEPGAPRAKSPAGLPNIEADSYASEEGGKVIIGRNAKLESNGALLQAKLLRFDTRNGQVIAEGAVVYATNSLRILADKVTVDPVTDTIHATHARFGRAPVYFTAEDLLIVKGDKTMKGVRMWNSEPAAAGMHLGIREVVYTEKEDWLSLRGVTPHLAGLPFFYLPAYGQEGYSDIPYDLYLNMGSTDNQGSYLRSYFLARQNSALWVGGLLDYYTKSGFLWGPAIRFDNTKQGKGTLWKGNLQAGYIDDQGGLDTDVYGRIPGRGRNFALGEIHGRTADGMEIAGALLATSDPHFLRDFRPNLIGRTGNPQATLEVAQPLAGGYLSANLTAKTDNYQDIVQKLPELRFDLPALALGESDWKQRCFVTLGYLSERPSADLPLAGGVFQSATGSTDAWSTARLDAYYGVTRPLVLNDWLTFKPVAGVRTTGWSAGLNNAGTSSKVIGQVGFDLDALVTGSWNLQAAHWGIDGLRHSFRPTLQYRYMPGADRFIGTLPMSERAISASALEEVDLADRLDAAATTDTQVARFGFRNTLETRDANAGTREVLRADIFTDWRQDLMGSTRSDVHTALRLTPAPWLSIESAIRLPDGGGAPLESLQSLTLRSGDFWRTSFNWVELRQVTNARQFIWDGRVTLNSVYSLVAQMNYDALARQATYESIGIVQRIGNSWELEYAIDQRLTTLGGGGRSLGFHLRARLFKF